jgi:hypothetical protein
MAGMCHHREGHSRQHGPQQYEVIVTEAARQIGRKRIADAGAVGRVPVRTEADDLREIIGSAGGGEIFENGKIEQCLGSGETPTQVLPGISLLGGVFYLPDQIAEGAIQQDLLVLVAAEKLRRLNGVEIPPPGVAVAAPLRMQCRHSYEGAPQRHPGDHEAPTETVENRGGVGAANSFAYHPHVQFDDLPTKRAVEAQWA